MFCTQSEALKGQGGKMFHQTAHGTVEIQFQNASADFRQLLQQCISPKAQGQLDFVVLATDPRFFTEDLLAALEQAMSGSTQISVSLHSIQPFKDLLGAGHDVQSLAQFGCNKQLLQRLQKQFRLNQRLIMNISHSKQTVQQLRVLILNIMGLRNAQPPAASRIIALDFRGMDKEALDHSFALYGQPSAVQQVGESAVFGNYSTAQFDKQLNYVKSKIQEKQKLSLSQRFSQAPEVEHEIVPSPAQRELRPLLQSNIDLRESIHQRENKALDELRESIDHLRASSRAKQQVVQHRSPCDEAPEPSKRDSSPLSIPKLQAQLRLWETKYEALRKEKMIIESGKTKLIQENAQMREELVELRESCKLKQSRIQKLEGQIHQQSPSKGGSDEAKLAEQNKRLQDEVDSLRKRLHDAETRTQKVLLSSRELREQMKMMAEQIIASQ